MAVTISGDGTVTGLSLGLSDSSYGSSGYAVFPDGMIIQWGSTTASGGSSSGNNNFSIYSKSMSFPISFPTSCLQVITSTTEADWNGRYSSSAWSTSKSSTGFTMNFCGAYNSGHADAAQYIAIGY